MTKASESVRVLAIRLRHGMLRGADFAQPDPRPLNLLESPRSPGVLSYRDHVGATPSTGSRVRSLKFARMTYISDRSHGCTVDSDPLSQA